MKNKRLICKGLLLLGYIAIFIKYFVPPYSWEISHDTILNAPIFIYFETIALFLLGLLIGSIVKEFVQIKSFINKRIFKILLVLLFFLSIAKIVYFWTNGTVPLWLLNYNKCYIVIFGVMTGIL